MPKTIKNMISGDKFNWFFFFVIIIFITIFYSEFANSNSIFVTFSQKFVPLKIPYIGNIVAFAFALMCLIIAYIIALIIGNKIYELLIEIKNLFNIFNSKKEHKVNLLKNEHFDSH